MTSTAPSSTSAAATRVAFLHTGAVVIPPVMELVGEQLPGLSTVNYLDDRIVPDLADPAREASVPDRLADLAAAAKSAGADVLMFTCSSISHLAASTAEKAGIPVLRIDEAMADEAVAGGGKVTVLATLPTTLNPTLALLRERAELAGTQPELSSEVVPGAFEAVAGGDRATHDRLVAEAIERHAPDSDVVVLAQASMASAAEASQVTVPVLTSLRPGIARLAERVQAG
ncbi:aspartate/glutamate racemase family protein [Ruania halotolerans]|uniref:aspartate/glutamate racemase family protein n=1 Tax=Ruania halotolerans TaxID=2897773 RepID=UPI001E35AFCB|nr:aspartate/glutamate racemase family protein [Ruania halotolerans]UFU06296.1 aspartate/glutamate racemase family protein [Ruania halotolerans]